jgi:AP2 domain
MRRIDVRSGTVFGRLAVVEEAPKRGGRRAMLCRCECGTQKAVLLYSLRGGGAKSCGCLGTGPSRARLQPGEVPLFGKRARGRVAAVDLGDYDLVMRYRWHVREADPVAPGRRPNGPYAVADVYLGGGKSRTITMHALIMGRPYIDHIDSNGLNNKRSNLRPATPAQNGANARKNPGKTSRYKGVFWDRWRSCWSAKIMVNRQTLSLGRYAHEEDAALAYDIAAREEFGEFALTNFLGEPTQARRVELQARRETERAELDAEIGREISARLTKWWSEHPTASHTCTVCGKEFQSRANVARVLYCSGACKNRKYLQRLSERQQAGRLF